MTSVSRQTKLGRSRVLARVGRSVSAQERTPRNELNASYSVSRRILMFRNQASST